MRNPTKTLQNSIFISKHYPSIFLKALNFFPKPGCIHDSTAHCPGEFHWQNQTVLNVELLGARRIVKYDHPIGR